MIAGSYRLGRRHVPLLALASILFSFIATAHAQPLGAEPFCEDLDQTITCRRLMLEDPILGPLNLGVRVRNRVATLWGPTPSRDVSRRAEQCLRTMIELADVKNELRLAPYADWGTSNFVPGLPQVLPDQAPPMLPDPMRRPMLPGRADRDEAALARVD